MQTLERYLTLVQDILNVNLTKLSLETQEKLKKRIVDHIKQYE